MATNRQLTSPPAAARQKRLSARAGALAVYQEGALLAIVQLHGVQVKPDGVRAEVGLVQRLACAHKGCYVRKRWEIWSVWDYFGEGKDSWGSSIVGWLLDFDHTLIAELSDFCTRLPVKQAAEVRWQKVHEFIADIDRQPLPEPARRTVLDRLLALNHQRYAEEVKSGLHDKGAKKAKGKKKAVTHEKDLFS